MNSKKLKVKREKVLADTVSFYNSNNQSKEYGRYKYITKNGRISPIGKLISKKLAEHLSENFNPSAVGNKCIFVLLPEKVQRLGQDFLEELQALHDEGEHWNEKGLTENGIDFVKEICNLFGLDVENIFKNDDNE